MGGLRRRFLLVLTSDRASAHGRSSVMGFSFKVLEMFSGHLPPRAFSASQCRLARTSAAPQGPRYTCVDETEHYDESNTNNMRVVYDESDVPVSLPVDVCICSYVAQL